MIVDISQERSTKNFQKHLTVSLKSTRTEGACLPSHNCLHSQEDGTNIFPCQLHSMSELYTFHHKHLKFKILKDCSKFYKRFSLLRGENDNFARSFKKVSQQMYFILPARD